MVPPPLLPMLNVRLAACTLMMLPFAPNRRTRPDARLRVWSPPGFEPPIFHISVLMSYVPAVVPLRVLAVPLRVLIFMLLVAFPPEEDRAIEVPPFLVM